MLAQVGSPCSDPQSQSGKTNFQKQERNESSNIVDIPEVGPNGLKQQAQQCSGCPGKRASGAPGVRTMLHSLKGEEKDMSRRLRDCPDK